MARPSTTYAATGQWGRTLCLAFLLGTAVAAPGSGVAAQGAIAGIALQRSARGDVGAWLSLGLGIGAAQGEDGGAALVQLVTRKGGHHVMARAAGIGHVISDGGENMGDLGLLYGRSYTHGGGHLLLAAGPARAGGDLCRRGDLECADGGRLGLALSAEAVWEPTPVLGLGLQMWADLNGTRSFGGAVLLLQVGWFP